MKKLFLGALAGLIWIYAFSLALCPIYNYTGILAALGCITGGLMLFGLGCTVAMAATEKQDDTTRRNEP